MERNQRSEWVRGFEDLEVFRRAYRVSLESCIGSEPRIPGDRAAGAGRPDTAGIQIDLRQSGRRVRPATCLETGVSPVRDDGVGLGRRDAGVDDLLPGSRLYRREDGGSLAGRISGNRPDAHRPASR